MKKLLLSLFSAAALASAATVGFTDRASFLAANPGLRNIDFSGIADTGGITNVSGGLTIDGVRFTPQGSTQLFVADRDFPGFDFGAPAYLSPQLGFPSTVLIELPSRVHAVGMDFTGFLGESINFGVTLTTSRSSLSFAFPTAPFPPLGFIGFFSPDEIRSITFSSTLNDAVHTNFVFGNPIPEPGTGMMMAGAGLLLLAWSRRTRQ